MIDYVVTKERQMPPLDIELRDRGHMARGVLLYRVIGQRLNQACPIS